MPRKNLEVTVVGGGDPRVPEAPKFEVPAPPPLAPAPEPSPVDEETATPEPVAEEKTKPSRRSKKNGR